MNLSNLGALLAPPIITSLWAKIRGRSGLPGWYGTYRSMDEALDATRSMSYQNIAQDTSYIEGRLLPKPSTQSKRHLDIKHLGILTSILTACYAKERDTLIVLDFGGGAGLHFHRLRSFIPYGISLKWGIVELPSVAEIGRTESTSHELTYFSSLEEFRQAYGIADIVIASGVLQTMENPLATLRELAVCGAYIILANLPLLRSESDFVAVNHAETPSYPLWFFSERKFVSELPISGLHVLMYWQAPETFWVVNGARSQPATSILAKSEVVISDNNQRNLASILDTDNGT
ncbi:MAG: methyltransferase, TIGR04325 family [Rhodocyclaceae bacterium]